MTEHVCCEHAQEWYADAERAWTVIAELERRGLVVANAVRGSQRYINGQHHHGRRANVAPAAVIPSGSTVPTRASPRSGANNNASPSRTAAEQDPSQPSSVEPPSPT